MRFRQEASKLPADLEWPLEVSKLSAKLTLNYSAFLKTCYTNSVQPCGSQQHLVATVSKKADMQEARFYILKK